MSTLIPNMTFSEFKKLKAADLRMLKSVEITSDGTYLMTVLIPHGDINSIDFIRINSEALGVKANITGGLDPAREESVAV